MADKMTMAAAEMETKIQVDRRRLEAMITGTAPGENAESFFARVERCTGAKIGWPSRLKIRAKTKKDPFVKLTGTAEGVHRAVGMIGDRLWVKRERVTLKVEISHCLHSQIIGRGGRNTQKIMHDTGCHIHFPDANKLLQQMQNTTNNNTNVTAAQAKNDQVSISGCAKDVEQAREMLRAISTLAVSVTIQLAATRNLAAIQPHLDPVQLQRHFPSPPPSSDGCSTPSGQVSLQFVGRAEIGGGGNVVGRGGGRGTLHFVMRATSQHQLEMLRAFGRVCELIGVFPSATELFCCSQFEIRPLALPSLSAVRWIAFRTNTQIHVNAHGLLICGPLEGIFVARKFITGLLPVSLHFDKPAADVSMSKNDNSSSNALTTLEQELDVQIVEKRRKLVAASNTKTAKTRRGEEAGSDATTVAAAAGEFVVCTYEANLFNAYLARNRLLQLDDNRKQTSASLTGQALEKANLQAEQQKFPQDNESAALMRSLCRESLMADQQPTIAEAAATVFGSLSLSAANPTMMRNATTLDGGIQSATMTATFPPLNETELNQIASGVRTRQNAMVELGAEAPKSPDPEESPIAAGLLAGAKSVNMQKGEFRKMLERERRRHAPPSPLLERLPMEYWMGGYGFSNSLPAELLRVGGIGSQQKHPEFGQPIISLWPPPSTATIAEEEVAKRERKNVITKEENDEMDKNQQKQTNMLKGRPIVGRDMDDVEVDLGQKGMRDDANLVATEGAHQRRMSPRMASRFVQSAMEMMGVDDANSTKNSANRQLHDGQQQQQRKATALVHPRVAALQAGRGDAQRKTPKFTMSAGGLTFEGRTGGQQAAVLAYHAATSSTTTSSNSDIRTCALSSPLQMEMDHSAGAAVPLHGGSSSSKLPCAGAAAAFPQLTPATAASVPLSSIKWDIRALNESAQVLAQLHLAEHIPIFRAQEIDMQAFLLLDAQCLASLGVTTLGARHKIMHAVSKLRESARQHGMYSL